MAKTKYRIKEESHAAIVPSGWNAVNRVVTVTLYSVQMRHCLLGWVTVKEFAGVNGNGSGPHMSQEQAMMEANELLDMLNDKDPLT